MLKLSLRCISVASLVGISVGFSSMVKANTWETLANINNPRFESSVIQYNDDIYTFNGFGTGIKIEPTIEKFDAGTRQWSVIGDTSTTMGNAVTHNGTVRVGNEVWIIGGRIGSHPGPVSSQVWKYNLNTQIWTSGPELPVPGAAGGAALVNNKVHWIGGLDSTSRCDVDNHYVYDLGRPEDGWQDISSQTNMPSPRNHFATVVVDDLIYAIGGQFTHGGCGLAGTPDTALVHSFNPATNQWTQKASLPAVQSHTESSTFVYNEAIYLVGGATAGSKVLRYDPSADSWEVLMDLPQALLAPIARVVDNSLIVSSGGTENIWGLPNQKTYSTPMEPLLLTPEVYSDVEDVVNETDHSLVALEAEYFDINNSTATHSWIVTNQSGASNDAAIVTTPDSNVKKDSSNGSPMVGYYAYFNRPGTWYVWVRGWGDSDRRGVSDSLHVGLNGEFQDSADKIEQFPSEWNWSNTTRDPQRATITVPTAGLHAINLWMREDGLIVDKIVLTTDTDYRPAGTGPSADDGSSDNTFGNGGGSTDDNTIEDTSAETEDESTETDETDSTNSEDGSGGGSEVGIVTLEAENYDTQSATATHEWVMTSNSSAIVTTPDSGVKRDGSSDSPMVGYYANFSRPGTWYVWVRGWGDSDARGVSDSLHVGLNGESQSSADKIDQFPSELSWTNNTRDPQRATITVPTAGLHTVNLWMREDGLVVDKILLTTDADYHPVGAGPTVDDGGGSSNPDGGDGSSTDDNTSADTTTESEDESPDIDETDTTNSNNDTGDNSGESASITLEAENYDFNTTAGVHSWIATNQNGASNNAAIVTTPDTNVKRDSSNGSPMVGYNAYFDRPGTWYVWIRGWGDSDARGVSDSLHVGLNGEFLDSADKIDQFPSEWTWSDNTRDPERATIIVPTEGSHVVNLWMREDGFIVDKLVLTTDSGYRPAGVGPTADNAGTGNTTVVTVNSAPVVSANANRSEINLDGFVTLSAAVSDDGASANTLSTVWRKLSGPGDVVFSAASNVNTQARFSMEGEYVLEVTASDGALSTSASVSVTVVTVADVSDVRLDAGREWVQISPNSLPSKRVELGAVAVDGKIYALGGMIHTRRTPVTAVEVYDPALNTWTHISDVPEPINHFQPVAYDGKIYIIGALGQGGFPRESGVSTIHVYDTRTNTWSTGGNVPSNRVRGAAGAVLYGNKIYIVGGNTRGHSGGYVTWFDEYNPETGEWKELRSMPRARDHLTVAVSGDRLVVAGGRQSARPQLSSDLEPTDIYRFDTGEWSTIDDIPTPRSGAMTVTVGEEVVVIGGESDQTLGHDEVEAVNVYTGEWRTLRDLQTGRHAAGATVLNNAIHVIGGNRTRGLGAELYTHEILTFD